MSSEVSQILGLIMFSVLVVSLIVEAILSRTWNKVYFTSGIPIFAMRVPVELRHSIIPSSSQLEAHFHSTWTSSLAFKEVDLHTYAFREKFFEVRLVGYSPIMHGVLIFNHNNNEVIVKGFANWFVLAFSLIWLSGIMLSAFPSFPLLGLGFILFFVLLMGLLYWIQYSRFSKVAMFAAETWSRKYARNVVGV